ncbi:hypothetical protein ACIBIZ_52180 [Nonomuraea spiralis]|uniref:hypothetical protein n=1 Tax=Nonomuraea spiralis TaxID=46182 RepID=UPI0037AEBB8B
MGLVARTRVEALQKVLTEEDGPQQALDELIAQAYAAGAPDNIACVVADVVPLDAADAVRNVPSR